MEPDNDPQFRELLKEWQVAGAPPSLDERVLGKRGRWWEFLLTGSIRVPVPAFVALAGLLVAMTAALVRQPAVAPVPAPVSLVDFRPADVPNVRVIRGNL
jgi:hypothetical protein